jgi:proteasome alpha subunit
VEGSSVEKIFLIDNHIAAASSGLTADARILINSCRSVAQSNKTAFDEPIGVRTLVKNICDYQQIFTQQAGLRPFGVALLIAGVYDNKSYLYETDPSGAFFGYKATAIGSGKTVAVETLEQEYKENINLEKAVLLGLKALNKATEGEIDSDTVDVWLVESKTEEFRALERKELESYIKKAQKKEEKGGE